VYVDRVDRYQVRLLDSQPVKTKEKVNLNVNDKGMKRMNVHRGDLDDHDE